MVMVCALASEAAASAVAHHPWMRMGGLVRWGLDLGGVWNVSSGDRELRTAGSMQDDGLAECGMLSTVDCCRTAMRLKMLRLVKSGPAEALQELLV